MSEPLASISVVIPAYNEEKYLSPGIAALTAEVRRAKVTHPGLEVEVVLVDNDSTDRTVALAGAAGFRVISEKEHKIARVRNAGVAAARGDVVVTIDADSQIGAGALSEVLETLAAGAIGGGCRIRMDEDTLKVRITTALVLFVVEQVMGLGGGMYFCRRADFEAIGGFDESLYAAEDLDFAQRLKARGKSQGRAFVNLRQSVMTTSARKMRLVGFWRLLGIALHLCWRPHKAIRRKALWNRLFYDVDRLR